LRRRVFKVVAPKQKAGIAGFLLSYCLLNYFAAGAASDAAAGAAASDAAGAAAGAEASAAGAGAAVSAAFSPQAVKERANRAATRAERFICFPLVYRVVQKLIRSLRAE
jgi:hypothetical protein